MMFLLISDNSVSDCGPLAIDGVYESLVLAGAIDNLFPLR